MKRLRELDMHLLVVFDSLCKTGSVTQTADQLSLTQGAVSQSLKKLRTLFGDELFVRSKAGLVRTQRGQELAQPIRELLFKGEEILLSQTAFDPEHAERNITLSMMDIGDVAIIPTLLKRLRQDAPGCTVQTRPVDVRAIGDAMEAGTIDLVIGGREISGGEIMRQKLYTQRLVLLAHEKSSLPDTIDMRELCSLDHVGIQTGSGSKSIYEKAMEVRGAQRRIVATTSHSLAIPYWLESDPHLVACVPIYLADLCVERGGFRVVQVEGGLPAIEIFQFWHNRYDGDRFSIWLRDVVRSAFLRHSSLDR